MRRIFILMILAAAHLACSAQTNPKIEALYDYLKAQGITQSYRLSNIDGDGLRKHFGVYLELFNENRLVSPLDGQYNMDSLLSRLPGVGVDVDGTPTINGKRVRKLLIDGNEVSLDGKVSVKTGESKIDSAYRAKAIRNSAAYKLIRRTVRELQEEAAESYSYEYHQHGADTIITTMALRNPANDSSNIYSHKYRFSPVAQVVRAPERIYFKYENMSESMKEISPYTPIGIMNFTYDGIVGNTPEPTKDFDVAALRKKLAPIFKDKRIKRHELLCRHDSTFDRLAYNDSLFHIGQHLKGIQSMTTGSIGPGGESQYTIYKYTDEEQAKAVMHQVLDCVCQQIKDNPEQAYSVMSDAYFGTQPIELFTAYPCAQSYKDYQEGKRNRVEQMSIMSYMDPDGFYIILNVRHGDDTFPYEWKTLKSMVNGEKVYYKEPL